MRAALSCGGKLDALIASFDGPTVGCDWEVNLQSYLKKEWKVGAN